MPWGGELRPTSWRDPINLIRQQVRELLVATRGAGVHEVVWDGRDEAGRPMRTGMYFPVLSTPKVRKVARLLLLR